MFEFGKLSKWKKMKARYDKGEIDVQTFVDTMNDTTLYCSTPVGEDKDVKPRLYALTNSQTNDGYYPAFLSKEHCARFFTAMGRNGFMIIENNLQDVLQALDCDEMLSKLGVIVEPDDACEMVVSPGIRVSKQALP